MDVLSDVLRVVRLTGAVYFDTHARAPWAIHSPAAAAVTEVLPSSERVIAFHFVLEGGAWAEVFGAGTPPIRLEPATR